MADKVVEPEDIAVPRVLIHGPGKFMYIMMFLAAGYKGTNNIEEADLVCFTGGEDVDPALYGEKPLNTTMYNVGRDKSDIEMFGNCQALGIPMVGICRGGQFLNVMCGGKMWQHVTGHTNGHFVKDVGSGKQFWCSSTHHQMMIPADKGAQVLAVASEATDKMGYGTNVTGIKPKAGRWDDVEVIWYEDEEILCFQPHPEMANYKECFNLFFDYVDQFIEPWQIAKEKLEWTMEIKGGEAGDEIDDDADLANPGDGESDDRNADLFTADDPDIDEQIDEVRRRFRLDTGPNPDISGAAKRRARMDDAAWKDLDDDIPTTLQ